MNNKQTAKYIAVIVVCYLLLFLNMMLGSLLWISPSPEGLYGNIIATLLEVPLFVYAFSLAGNKFACFAILFPCILYWSGFLILIQNALLNGNLPLF